MTRYRFLTTWLLDAPREAVWDTIYDAERWPRWWRGVKKVDIVGQGAGGVGDVWRSSWRSVLPYTLDFEVEIVRLDRPNILEGRATGELDGSGVWRVYESPLGTASTWEWHVGTTAAWMNVFGSLARPIFAANHQKVMRWGGEGVARELECRLIASS